MGNEYIFFLNNRVETPVFTEAKTNVLAVYSSEFATFKEKAPTYGTQAKFRGTSKGGH
jgi:hypothetical protein